MIPVAEALDRLFALVAPMDTESVPLIAAAGRVLAQDVVATRDQPPFAASAMDGYAVRRADIAVGAEFRVVGQAPAGAAWTGRVGPGEAVRIFTGAPLPDGADFVVIQEDTEQTSSGMRLARAPGENANVRPAGGDFRAGARVGAPRRLRPGDLALAAAMNADRVTVRRRPVVALLATGEELIPPGGTPRPDQIVSSNLFGLHGLFAEAGCETRVLPLARDTSECLRAAFDLAAGADLLVTTGGASVGDHDLVGPVAQSLGMEQAFYKVAIRPGKPLMAGRLRGAAMVGLPGNPVSAMVCAHIFVLPMIRVMLGFPPAPFPRLPARLGAALGENGAREHYMRARREGGADGAVVPFARQDSSLLSILGGADCLVVRPPGDPPRAPGETVEIVPLR